MCEDEEGKGEGKGGDNLPKRNDEMVALKIAKFERVGNISVKMRCDDCG